MLDNNSDAEEIAEFMDRSLNQCLCYESHGFTYDAIKDHCVCQPGGTAKVGSWDPVSESVRTEEETWEELIYFEFEPTADNYMNVLPLKCFAET